MPCVVPFPRWKESGGGRQRRRNAGQARGVCCGSSCSFLKRNPWDVDLGAEGLFEALVSLTREEAARLGRLHSFQGPVQDKNAESLVQKRFKTSKQVTAEH